MVERRFTFSLSGAGGLSSGDLGRTFSGLPVRIFNRRLPLPILGMFSLPRAGFG
jgi:hypothetical protein